MRKRGTRSRVAGPVRLSFHLRVYCEGEVSENIYLTHWYRKYRDRVVVSIADHQATTPLQLVQRAVREKKCDEAAQRGDKGRAYDEYWCVFDVDEHPNLDAALTMARDNDIKIALSNPCLELWFFLHFKKRTAWVDRADIQRACRGLLNCDKKLHREALELLDEKFEDAKKHAQELDLKHENDGTATPANPSSGMWRLIDRIRGSQ